MVQAGRFLGSRHIFSVHFGFRTDFLQLNQLPISASVAQRFGNFLRFVHCSKIPFTVIPPAGAAIPTSVYFVSYNGSRTLLAIIAVAETDSSFFRCPSLGPGVNIVFGFWSERIPRAACTFPAISQTGCTICSISILLELKPPRTDPHIRYDK